MQNDPDSPDSSEWVVIGPQDIHSPGRLLLSSPPLSVMSPSLSNRATPASSFIASPECSATIVPEYETTAFPPVALYGKLEFFCGDCTPPPGRYISNTTHTSRINDTIKFTFLSPEEQINGLSRNRDQVGLFNIVGAEHPSKEETWRVRAAIAVLNDNPQILGAIGYRPEGESPDHRWIYVEPYVRKQSPCSNCFVVFVKYALATARAGSHNLEGGSRGEEREELSLRQSKN